MTERPADRHDFILIIDFGSQVTQLIARRVREAGVYCEIVPFQSAGEAFERTKPSAVILSGGPASTAEIVSWRTSCTKTTVVSPSGWSSQKCRLPPGPETQDRSAASGRDRGASGDDGRSPPERSASAAPARSGRRRGPAGERRRVKAARPRAPAPSHGHQLRPDRERDAGRARRGDFRFFMVGFREASGFAAGQVDFFDLDVGIFQPRHAFFTLRRLRLQVSRHRGREEVAEAG